ncbi:MAG TPA: glycerol-3-phosphate 1-O-acyltransferase PlsY [Woeseiaceae bacterium]|nr:glycerol-3-phosphate 1-O-acyltransferase PlsY [Woeseiaceae bacterium]
MLSYLVGSLMGALIVGRLYGRVDIRTMGSGNAGGTNALRTQGALFAFWVLLIDIGKGAIGAGVIPALELPFVPLDPAISRTWLALCCAAAAVVGHVWPMYHRFRGGKGAATFVGTLLVLGPALIFPLVVVWASVIALSGYVGLATIAAAIGLPVWLAATHLPDDQPLFIYSAAMAIFIVYCHRSNVQRMKSGTENRNTKLMLFKPKPAAANKNTGNDDNA